MPASGLARPSCVALVAPPGCAACGRALAARGRAAVPACARALPWLRGGLPALRAARHRGRGCPAARRGVRARLGAAGLRGRRARARRRAEVPRRAAGRGPDGGAHGREPAGRRCAGRTAALVPGARPLPRAGGAARVRPGGACWRPRSRRRLERPLADAWRGATARRARSARAARARRAPGRLLVRVRGAAAAARAARRRRPHHRRHARRLRPRARRGGGSDASWPRSATRGRYEASGAGSEIRWHWDGACLRVGHAGRRTRSTGCERLPCTVRRRTSPVPPGSAQGTTR